MTRAVWRIGLVAVVCAVLTSAWADDARNAIGLAVPLSGIDAGFGLQFQQGAQQAVADLNEGGGFGTQSVGLISRDDGNDGKKAEAAARAFVNDGVRFVIGDFSSLATGVSAPIYAAAGTIQIAPAALDPSLTGRGIRTLFRLSGREDRQGELAARYLLSRHITRIAILHDRTAGSEAQASAFRSVMNKAGVREVYSAVLESGGDPASFASRLKASNAQVAFVAAGPAIVAQLARRLRDSNARTLLLATDAIASDDFATLAGNAADGTMMVFPQDPRSRPAAQDLLKRFRARGKEPGAYTFYAYAAVQVLQQAMASVHSTDPETIATALHNGLQLRTVLGDISFDENGDLRASDFTIYAWHKGATGRMAFDEQIRS